MKKFKLFALAAVTLLLGACSSDDNVINEVDPTPGVFTESEAYMRVRINDAASTRAKDESKYQTEYEDGEANEGWTDQAKVDFYFFDENGVFVCAANANAEKSDGKDSPNIELKTTSIIVLQDVKDKNFPKYMLTVVNKPSTFGTNFNAQTTIEKVFAELASKKEEVYDDNKFIMSTSSFDPTATSSLAEKYELKDAKGNFRYHLNVLTADNFLLEKDDITTDASKAKIVDVFVERLAVKVGVTLDNTKLTDKLSITPGTGLPYWIYKIKESTVAGLENGDIDNDHAAGTDLYVKFEGWGLNATSKAEYVSKHIDPTWVKGSYSPGDTEFNTATDLNFTWNYADFRRSFWAKSYNYGDLRTNVYPTNYSSATKVDKEGTGYTAGNKYDVKADNYYLNYCSYNEANKSLTADAFSWGYCLENTNNFAALTNANVASGALNRGAMLTSVLIPATICDANGKPLDLIRYRGLMFKKDQFIKYALQSLNEKGQLPVYKKTTTASGDVYNQIDASYFDWAKDGGDAKVKLVVKDGTGADEVNLTTAGVSWVLKIDDPADPKGYSYYDLDATTLPTIISDINTDLEALTKTTPAIAYNGGMCYYSVLIEHFNDTYERTPATPATNTFGINSVWEGNYGVVRNHIYKLSVEKVEQIGHGVFDPDEDIIPGDNTKEDEIYKVGARLNVLSWRLVTQGVNL